MGMAVSNKQTTEAVEVIVAAANAEFSDVLSAEVRNQAGGNRKSAYVFLQVEAESWRKVAKWLKKSQAIDYCCMITGIHWPDAKDMSWQVVIHLMRFAVSNPPVSKGQVNPVPTDASKLSGKDIPVQIEVSIKLPDGRSPSVPSVADVWVGADWNEKETWDLVGIEFEGHEGMRRVLLPHDSPTGYHPLQKQHKLRYHDFNEMYDDPQGFMRKPVDIGKVK